MLTTTWLFVLKPDGLLLFTRCLSVFIGPHDPLRSRLQHQKVNKKCRRCACSPKNYHSAALEAMNSVRKTLSLFSWML